MPALRYAGAGQHRRRAKRLFTFREAGKRRGYRNHRAGRYGCRNGVARGEIEKMKAAGRHLRIRGLMESQEFIDLTTLCRELDASESSVRRDLSALEKDGVLKRVYGGAMAAEPRDRDLDFDWQSARMADEKNRIGAAAAELVEDGQTVILGGG